MRRTTAVIFALATASVACATEPRRVPKAESERDLVLEAAVVGPAKVEAGQWFRLKASIVNRSKDAAHHVVLPGDGSESGLREPHVWCTGEAESRGTWRTIEPQPLMRCGLYAADWSVDVREIAAGARLDITEWLHSPSMTFDLQTAGRMRFVLHYKFDEGRSGKGGAVKAADAPKDLGGMTGVEAFELASAPFEIEVVRPLDVTLTALRTEVKTGTKWKASDLLDARVVNTTKEARRIDPSAWRVSVWSKGMGPANLDPTVAPAPPRAAHDLAPGASEPLFAPGAVILGAETMLGFETEGEASLCVMFETTDGKGARIRSDWVTVRIVK